MKLLVFILILLNISSCSKNSITNSELTPEEASKVVTFNKNIKPLLTDKCSPCHTDKGERVNKYVEYNTAKTLLTGIMGRVTRASNDPLLMPQGGPRLSQAQIDLLNKWIDDGLLEK
jgi:hypothetical protein